MKGIAGVRRDGGRQRLALGHEAAVAQARRQLAVTDSGEVSPRRFACWRPGFADAIVVAGTERFWSWVRIRQVDDDGQVHFEQIDAEEAARTVSRAS